MDLVRTISQFTGNRFQDLVSRLLSAHIPDFQAVNGAGGDSGNDGYSPAMAALFQVYGPEKVQASQIRKKIDASVKKAIKLRKKDLPGLRKFVFITSFDLTHDQHLYLQQVATKARLISESWGNSRLAVLVAQHRETVRDFPEIQIMDIAKAIQPDPDYIKKYVNEGLAKVAEFFIIREALENVEALERAVRTWLDPNAAERARMNFPASAWNGRLGLLRLQGNFSQFKEMGLAAARDPLKRVLDQLDKMLKLHEEHAYQPPPDGQQELAAKFFEYAEQFKRMLNEGLAARQ